MSSVRGKCLACGRAGRDMDNCPYPVEQCVKEQERVGCVDYRPEETAASAAPVPAKRPVTCLLCGAVSNEDAQFNVQCPASRTGHVCGREQYEAAGHLPPRDAAYPDNNPKTVAGAKKPGFAAVPPVALLHLAQVMEHGAAKYGQMNWRKTSVAHSVYFNAILRHLLAWHDGQDIDPDSGQPHLAHIMASAALVLDGIAQGVSVDDRPTPGKFAEVLLALSKVA